MTDLKREAESVAAEILALPRRPLTLFGHSLGASFAHEVALTLTLVSAPIEHLVLSARLPSDRPRPVGLVDLADEQLRNELRTLSEGPNPLDDDELWSAALPGIRADIQCLKSYRRPLHPVLMAPITAVGGTRDRDVDRATLTEWGAATRGPFQVRMLQGGHFYLNDAIDDVISVALNAPDRRRLDGSTA